MSERAFSDEQAVKLLALLCEYFEAYPEDGSPTELTAADLASDLIESLPYGRLREGDGSGDLSLRFASVVAA